MFVCTYVRTLQINITLMLFTCLHVYKINIYYYSAVRVKLNGIIDLSTFCKHDSPGI